ncbi:class I adenylate-forming enzyme family protein [Hydrogenophaga sp. BPS33]|uniref:class I adenylate-forming enzyme family protein n=1 Tax=Hydrogenophaga sp. BPS33 TaxID=2651974 RepID=UPI00131FBFEE|nr:AMP-binding protein [Hydrogenophaga sp. BPS33]QHE87547.1 ATP-dependent acyl-CoA ligase [Hydrogenophaga sp. BPS33]
MQRRTPLEVTRLYPDHGATLPGLLASREQQNPEAPFLLFAGKTWTRQQFLTASRQLATGLAAWGVSPGSRVAITATNHEAHVLLLFALAHLNAAMVPLNPAATAAEMRYVLEKSQVSAVAVSPATLAVTREAIDGLADQPRLLDITRELSGLTSLAELMAQAIDAPLPQPDAEATCLVIFTSGTTGFPKGVMHSQKNFVVGGEANVSRLWLQPEDRVLTVMPLFHTNALFYSLAGSCAAGACMILLERFSASTFWNTAVDTGATTVNFIEAIGRILKARPRSEFRPDHRIESVYGARADIQDCFRDEFHIRYLISGFGMTEIPGVCCVPFGGPALSGSMGKLGQHPDPDRQWAQARIVDDNGVDLPDGQTGEFWVRHPIIMQGYLGDPAQTADAFHDGWFKTGDLVRRDADGVYWFVTRKKDIIRRRGENISGAELDRLLAEHPAIVEVATVPVPSELGEDEVLACVVKRPDHSLSEAELHRWCQQRMTAIKVPRFILFVDDLPHTPTHKVAKQVLKDSAVSLQRRAHDFNPA